MRAALVDFETTNLTKPSVSDLEKQPHIIEIGIVLVVGGKIVEEYSQLVKPPGGEVTAEITKITGITNEMLADAPPFAETFNRICDMFEGAEYFIAHNAAFDKACLSYELARLPLERLSRFSWPPEIICTVQEYLHEFGHRPKLTELYEAKMGKPLEQTHRALDDIKALAEILIKEGVLT